MTAVFSNIPLFSVSPKVVVIGGQNITDGGEAANLNRLIDEFGLQRVSSRVYI